MSKDESSNSAKQISNTSTPITKKLLKKGGLKLKMKLASKRTLQKVDRKPTMKQVQNRKPILSNDHDDVNHQKPIFHSLESKIASITSINSRPESETKSSSSQTGNVKSNDEFDNHTDDPWESLLDQDNNPLLEMSDTLLALQSIIQRNAAAFFEPLQILNTNDNYMQIQGYPFVLRQMLHQVLLSQSNSSSTNDTDNHALAATNVMEEISTLQRQNKVRLLKLPTALSSNKKSTIHDEEDIAIIETKTYIQAIQQATDEYSKQEPNIQPIINTFLTLLPTETRMTVSHSKLCQLFPSIECIDQLVQKRFLVPSSSHQSCSLSSSLSSTSSNSTQYYFTLPTLGKAVHQVHHGRQSVLKRLRSSYRKEIPRKVLLDKGVSRIPNKKDWGTLPMAFHLRDLISLGRVVLMERPSGTFVKLVENG